MGGMGPAMGVGFGGFLSLWVVMMAAMMVPSVGHVATGYLRAIGIRSRGGVRAIRTTGLVSGYLLAWAAYGVPAFGMASLLGSLEGRSPYAAAAARAVAFAAAGLYQLTPLKKRCLAHCRSPLGILLHIGGYRGRLRDVRAGLFHGAYCVGCCWALMLVLVAVGAMNLAWMVGLAAVVLIEKTWRHGESFSRAVGVVLLVLAVASLAFSVASPGMQA
jgi:predicted metal-binding membrane protein